VSIRVGKAGEATEFPIAARALVNNSQLRHNVRHATDVIRGRRARAVAEMPDWEPLRDTASEIKGHTLRYLESYLVQFEEACTKAGGKVHWLAIPMRQIRSSWISSGRTMRRKSSK
jgi:L-lactate dehydrogenase complex protein LldF